MSAGFDEDELKPGEKEILTFLDRHGVVDKDAAKGTRKNRKSPQKRGSRKEQCPVLDLHGMTGDRAESYLRIAIPDYRDNGVSRIVIIHGHGLHSNPAEGPVLRPLVQAMLERDLAPFVRDYRSASPREGGDGATVVFLR